MKYLIEILIWSFAIYGFINIFKEFIVDFFVFMFGLYKKCTYKMKKRNKR